MSLQVCAGCSTRYAAGLVACPNCRSVERAPDAAVVVPLMVGTACANSVCAASGVQRRVMLARPAPGVVELPALLCERCGHVLPLSWSGPSVEDSVSPKITRHGGATNKNDPETAAAPELADGLHEDSGTGEPMQAVDGDEATGDGSGRALPPVSDEEYGPGAVPLEGGEEPSPGTDSSTSTEKPSTTSVKSKPAPRRRTPRGSRSTPDQTESSSPGSPDISGPATEPPTDGDEA